MDRNSRIYVAGHQGLVGSALVRNLKNKGYKNLIVKTQQELDLTNQTAVDYFFETAEIDYVFLAAAKVGGIGANCAFPADFILENQLIQCNVIANSYKHRVKKLLFLGSSCIYPKLCPQPIKEEYLLTGPLEKTNEAYALAKISGLKMCQYFNHQYGTNNISVMPTNLYGPNDRFDAEHSHVVPAMIVKMDTAKSTNSETVELWGTGKPRREFLYVDDMADACIFLMEEYNGTEHLNIGTGKDISIKELAYMIKDIVGYEGKLIFNKSNLDGTPRKLLDVSKIERLGWKAKMQFEEGLRNAYQYYLEYVKKNT
ncbi:GDP-L-fucose synthase family protein [Paenibacillus farraposensis]|uniref:GDP-L-fucose synthase n=1 Tax=Paenibacillus farraposensis TaxID=2807095 RepID=A0ABW4DGB6_9BACL|nr:GDP-L-fucose synthase [Paenibacillus farraposensis]MCC3380783.1 GDP-L-fucose synthase [Paenibacillus farraposensis]